MKKTIAISVVIAMTAFAATIFNRTFSSTQAEIHLCEKSHQCKQMSPDDSNELNTDCQAINYQELHMKIESGVTDVLNGTHTIMLGIKVVDTVTFTSVNVDAGNYFGLANFPLDTGVSYLPDSNTYQLTFTYNPTQLPAYYQEVRITLFSEKDRYDEFIYLYFDNDSLYTWSVFDFLNLDREWIEPTFHESINISLGEADTFTIPAFDTLLPYQFIQVPGKAYCVPVNIDTADLEEGEYFRRSTKEFNGRITGRLTGIHLNDFGTNVDINIVKIKVEIWEYRGWPLPDKKLTAGFTNQNGEFDLSYSRSKFTFGNSITVYVRVVYENEFVDVRNSAKLIKSTRTSRLGNITHNHNNATLQTFNLGMQRFAVGSLMKVFHWTSRAMEYVRSETAGWSNLDMVQVKVRIFKGWSSYSNSDKRISLNASNINDEGTVQHEAGHHIHFRVLQDGKKQPNTGGTHTLRHNNKHPKQTITEGFANAVAYITDARYYLDDDESGRNVHRQFTNLESTTHPFTAEELYARTLLDLFDDVNKFVSFGVPINTTWTNLITDEGLDFANFSYGEIMSPFYQNRSSNKGTIQDLGHYFRQLSTNTTCERRKHIKQVMDYNLINEKNLVFTERLSTDLIFVSQTIIHRDDNLSQDDDFNLVVGTHTAYNYTYHAIDRSELNTTTGSFNVTSSSNGWGEYISDPLTVTDGAILHINDNIESNWVNDQELRPAQGSHLMAYFCNVETTIEEDSRIIVGSALPQGGYITPMIATAYISSGTTIVLESGSELIINNNSKLVIEAGGRIDFHPGAKIVLNGDNAVLEIKGDIRLMPNADFAVEGGAQGFGYIKVIQNSFEVANKSIFGTENNRIILEGNGTNHTIMEVYGNEGWFVPNSIKETQISNCKIKIDSKSRIVMEMKYLLEMTDVEVNPLNTNQNPPHKGIQIWGWGAKSNLKRVTVTHGECGLMYYPMYNYEESKVQQNVRSYTHTVDNCNFESNIIGIEAIRVPVWVKDSYFNNYNDKGIHTSGTLGATYFVNNIFSGNSPNYKTVGISYTGANRLFLKKNTLYNNHIAIHANRALVSAGCNEILNNSDAFRLEDHADLYMSTKSVMSGFNNLYGNSTSIVSRYNGSVYLSEGFNIMKSQPDYLRKQLSFFINGDISKTMPNNTLDILSNYVEPEPEYITSDWQWNSPDWTEGNSHPPFNTFLYNRYAPHEMQYFTFGNTQPIINQDYNFYISNIVNECADTKWEGFSISANSNPIDYSEQFTPSQSMDLVLKSISSPNFPQKEIYEIKDILFMMGYDSTIQPSNIIELYKEVLLDYYESSSGIYIGYREILNQLIEQASFWANNNIIAVRQSDTMPESAEFLQICNLIDNMITESKLDINHFMHGREFELETKKAEIMRLSRNYDNALNYISILRNNYTGYHENFTLDNLACINNLENDLALGNIAPHQIIEQYTCLQNNFLDTLYAELNEVNGVVYNS